MTEIHELLARMNACEEAIAWADKWDTSGSPKTVWEACERSDWMLWLLARTTVDLNDPRLRLMACDFAETVLHLVPEGEDRPRKAIEAARAFCAGINTRDEMSAASSAAWSAAWSAARSAAMSAAWSAAGSAAMSAAWSAAMSTAWSTAWSAADAAMSAADAARSAAMSAARSAAWSTQANIIRRYFPKCPPLQAKYLKAV